jgi:hypothetical protein
VDKNSKGGKKIGKPAKLESIKTPGRSVNHNETVLRG